MMAYRIVLPTYVEVDGGHRRSFRLADPIHCPNDGSRRQRHLEVHFDGSVGHKMGVNHPVTCQQ